MAWKWPPCGRGSEVQGGHPWCPTAAWEPPRRGPGSRLSQGRAVGCLPNGVSRGGSCRPTGELLQHASPRLLWVASDRSPLSPGVSQKRCARRDAGIFHIRKVASQDLGRQRDVPAPGGQGDACLACPVYVSLVLRVAMSAHATGRKAESAAGPQGSP